MRAYAHTPAVVSACEGAQEGTTGGAGDDREPQEEEGVMIGNYRRRG